jgi:iron complex outermembrane receptor protein
MTRMTSGARRRALATPLLLLCSAGQAAEPTVASTAPTMEEIIVKGEVLDRTDRAWSSTTFDAAAMREFQPTQVQDLFDQVPGMSARNFGLAGVADSFTIRGFGGGGHGGDLGVVLDGIPLNEAMSHADGYVDLNVVIPVEVRAMTVYKGPVSALYGNFNRGGLLRIDTRRGGDYGVVDLNTGSNGLLDVQGAYGKAFAGGQQLDLAAQVFQSDGFRPRSDSDRATVAGSFSVPLGDRTRVGVSGRWHTADSNNASYLTEAQYLVDPYGIDPDAQNDGAEKDFAIARLDVDHELTESIKLLGFAYTTQQDFSRWFSRPSGGSWRQREETYDREVYGAGASLNARTVVAGTTVSWVAGVETFRESTGYLYFDDLDMRRRTGPAINDRETELDSTSAFLELQAEVHPLFMPSVGLRYDRFDGTCTPLGPETGTQPCQDLNGLDNLAPKLGVRSRVLDGVELRASYAQGFALPNGWVKYQFEAANLDPVEFDQVEVGANWTPVPQLSFDVAVFRLDSSGEVRTLAPGEFENYGETRREGIEASVDWSPIDSFSLSAVYGTADATVERNGDPSVLGNAVGGVADRSANVIALWSFLPAWQLDVTWRHVGEFPLNTGNTFFSEPYDVVDVGVRYTASGPLAWTAYARVENAADEVFAPSQFVIGGPVYGTGAPRQVRVGFQLNL